MGTTERIPIIVLGGSDLQPTDLPEHARDKHPLAGYKGAELCLDGHPLVRHVVDWLRASGKFEPIYLAGPYRVYERVNHGAILIDSDGTFGENIQASLEAVSAAHPRCPVAFTTCDILPDPDALRRAMHEYDLRAPCDLWFPVIRAPASRRRLGASSWKPHYRIVPAEGEDAVEVLPGHLVVADPTALRLRFVYRLLQVGYRTRNRPIGKRRRALVWGVLAALVREDLSRLLGFRPPTAAWRTIAAGLRAGKRLQKGTITRRELEDALQTLFVRDEHRRRHPERGFVLPVLDELSLARDIDTVEEAREAGSRMGNDPRARVG